MFLIQQEGEHMGLNELIFNIGLIICGLSITLIIATIIALKIKKIKLDVQLDNDYGEVYKKPKKRKG